ncbi:MAG: hypothetical protein ACKVY0_07150 [Prosthecobacter sp.]|uniref:hypothetical protein n=1 Tax=Prosthecobacter sp. TaxID=1965333 RepID=UPI003901F9C0
MKTTSSHLTRGVIIAVSLLVLAQAWRVGQRSELQPESSSIIAEPEQAPPRPTHPVLQSYAPLKDSLEFGSRWQRPHNPWKDPTDPDEVWHQQRQRASELLIRSDLPALDK